MRIIMHSTREWNTPLYSSSFSAFSTWRLIKMAAHSPSSNHSSTSSIEKSYTVYTVTISLLLTEHKHGGSRVHPPLSSSNMRSPVHVRVFRPTPPKDRHPDTVTSSNLATPTGKVFLLFTLCFEWFFVYYKQINITNLSEFQKNSTFTSPNFR